MSENEPEVRMRASGGGADAMRTTAGQRDNPRGQALQGERLGYTEDPRANL